MDGHPVMTSTLTAMMARIACSTRRVVDGTFDSAVLAGRTGMKSAVGAGRMVVRDGNCLVAGDAEE